MLESRSLAYQYTNGPIISFPDFTSQKGEHSLLIGPSGCGKTTLLHLLGGLIQPTNGSVTVAGQNLAKLSGANRDQFRGQHIGIVFQKSHFIRSLTVEQNILIAQFLAGKKQDRQKVKTILTQLNLADKRTRMTGQLSQGEQQRVAIARALINDPAIILADEPTAALDDYHCHEVLQLLLQQADASGATLLIVTHDQRLKDQFEKKIELKPIR